MVFSQLSCLVPRGRYDVELAANFMRLRGKSHDLRILYSQVTRLVVVPRPPDGSIVWFAVGLEPPIKQGMTRYPFLVFQFSSDEVMQVTLPESQAELDRRFHGRLRVDYDDATWRVVSSIFAGLADKPLLGDIDAIISASQEDDEEEQEDDEMGNGSVRGKRKASAALSSASSSVFRSAQGAASIRCSVKANEEFLFPLAQGFFCLPKPTAYVPHTDIASVQLTRMDGSLSKGSAAGSLRSFDLRIVQRRSIGSELVFSNVSKEELLPLERYLTKYGIPYQNDLDSAGRKGSGQGGDDEDDLDDSEDDEDYEESDDDDDDSDDDGSDDDDGSEEEEEDDDDDDE